MGITNSTKTLSQTQIDCGGQFTVRLSLTAEPDITSNPTDIVLILDRSGSMSGSPLANLKNGAKKFIEIIDETTDGTEDGQIGGGSHIGIVSFSDTATQDTGLITSVAELNAAVDALDADGSTNHEDAFTKALELFDGSTASSKVIVMFTDGITTAGGDPVPVTDAIKAQGIVIYCIGLVGGTGLDVATLNDWSSDPDSAYVAVTPDDAELEELFENLAENISNPGATNITLIDTVSDCFRVVGIRAPTKGSAGVIGDTSVKWEIDELGTTASEGAALEFTVEHVGPCTGTVEVNESIEYSDDEGNAVSFGSPEIEVQCNEPIIIEECPEPVSVTVGGCSDTVEYDAGDLFLASLGRILRLDITLRNVCPNRRVALAVVLNEVDAEDTEYKRGLKTFVVPAHDESECRDIVVRCINFVLPEELDVSGTAGSLCNERRFRARFIAHYIDNDFECCDSVEE